MKSFAYAQSSVFMEPCYWAHKPQLEFPPSPPEKKIMKCKTFFISMLGVTEKVQWNSDFSNFH